MECSTCGTKNLGVKCEVQNCKYHSKDNRCYADCIQVGPNSADCCSDTVCETFEAK